MRARTATDVGNLIRQRRQELSLSQSDLAAAAGVTRQWVVRFEQGRSDVTLRHILAVITALDLDLSIDPGGSPDADVRSRRTPRVRVSRAVADRRLTDALTAAAKLDTQDYETVRASLEADRLATVQTDRA